MVTNSSDGARVPFRDYGDTMKVLDLFCGMGGLGYGFARAGFRVTGVDINRWAGETYLLNGTGEFLRMNLIDSHPQGVFDVIIGGPPCQPWSALNTGKRGSEHPLYGCMDAYFRIVERMLPNAFILENVPGMGGDPEFRRGLWRMRCIGYSVGVSVLSYSDFGSAWARKRLFAIGVRREFGTDAETVFKRIPRDKTLTLRHAIGDLAGIMPDASIDHIWPRVNTISRYLRFYRTGKYGWYVLDWDRPAPSFGNICKTYILHPDSFNGGETRPISVREALRIAGFPDDYRFPVGCPMTMKYQMIADTVSPAFSQRLAVILKRHLLGGMLPDMKAGKVI